MDARTAQDTASIPAGHMSTTDISVSDVTTTSNDEVVDLYSMTPDEHMNARERPFVHHLLLHTTKGEITRVKALFDGGAMVGAMCASFFHRVKHRLGSWEPSLCRLQMANGVIV